MFATSTNLHLLPFYGLFQASSRTENAEERPKRQKSYFFDFVTLWLTLHPCFPSVARRGKMGFDFLEFEFQSNGKMRYVNSTKYKGEVKIQKSGMLSSNSLLAQFSIAFWFYVLTSM